MKWIGISGSWRKINQEIEEKLRGIVKDIIQRGDGVVSGGALGVDFIATDEALKHNPEATQIRIFLPTTLEKYSEHYRKHASLGNITKEQAENLINQLNKLKNTNSSSLMENPDTDFNEENKKARYYERNAKVVNASDELVAFRVKTEMSESLGTEDTVEKAHQKGIPVQLFTYDLTNNAD
ncbi:MAG: DNA-processing protein DprA [Candidatus Colwellbacteria bacterium]|nr:DNA-processing protein DprA [Candidatus Colwellbacteria bacterium]